MSKQKKSGMYREQELEETWSFESYGQYEDAKSRWYWENLPFSGHKTSKKMWRDAPGKIQGSILEIGSAAAGAYDFMKDSGLIDLSDYTGLEISRKGHEYSKKKHPSANWIQADVTRYEPERNYDYVFERIAVHHMPEPLAVFDKFSKVTNKAFSTSFVSCLNGDTISDLSVARYRHSNGDYVFFNIINVFEVIEILYQNGFNRISFLHGGLHEKCYHDPLAHQYISPDVNWKQRIVSRCSILATKSGDGGDLQISTAFTKSILVHPRVVSLIKKRIKRMCGKRDGVLYDTECHAVR